MLIILVLSILLNLVLIYTTWNLFRKNEKAETIIVSSFTGAQSALSDMRELDATGAFEADDDVGATFAALRSSVEDYAKFMGVEEEQTEEE